MKVRPGYIYALSVFADDRKKRKARNSKFRAHNEEPAIGIRKTQTQYSPEKKRSFRRRLHQNGHQPDAVAAFRGAIAQAGRKMIFDHRLYRDYDFASLFCIDLILNLNFDL